MMLSALFKNRLTCSKMQNSREHYSNHLSGIMRSAYVHQRRHRDYHYSLYILFLLYDLDWYELRALVEEGQNWGWCNVWVETSKDEVYDSSIQHIHLHNSYSSIQLWLCSGMCHYNFICRNKSMVFSYDIPRCLARLGHFPVCVALKSISLWLWLCVGAPEDFPIIWDINNYTGPGGERY